MPPGRLRAAAVLVAAMAVFAGATAGMVAGREPFATWYYQLAWYTLLLATDATLRLATGRWFLLERPRSTATLFAWSVPFWLLFELINFRMANWYYVFLPADPVARWAGITIAFATVLPAIRTAERALAAAGLSGPRTRTLAPHPRLPSALQLVGVGMVLVALAWPAYLFPLIWGAVTLLLDPLVYRRDPSRSLLGDLAAGRPGRILRLLLGGLAIGLIWEAFNFAARGKWIYTVPGLEELKLFEMPVAGFLGFPILALDGWAFWQTLVVTGLAPELGTDGEGTSPDNDTRTAPGTRARTSAPLLAAFALIAVVFSAAVLRGIERYTISSYAPALEDLPSIEATPLRAAGYDAFDLAGADPAEVARRAGVPMAGAERAVEVARLATLRGIGAEHASRLVGIGVTSVAELASRSAPELADRLPGSDPDRKTLARLRVWIRAAKAESARDGPE